MPCFKRSSRTAAPHSTSDWSACQSLREGGDDVGEEQLPESRSPYLGAAMRLVCSWGAAYSSGLRRLAPPAGGLAAPFNHRQQQQQQQQAAAAAATTCTNGGARNDGEKLGVLKRASRTATAAALTVENLQARRQSVFSTSSIALMTAMSLTFSTGAYMWPVNEDDFVIGSPEPRCSNYQGGLVFAASICSLPREPLKCHTSSSVHMFQNPTARGSSLALPRNERRQHREP